MKDLVFIYTLTDPRNGFVRYVGKAIDIGSRFKSHLVDKSQSHKARWVRQLQSLGLNPIIDVIETSDTEGWQEAEKFWIESFRQMGCELTNLDGGGIQGKSVSSETRAKLSNSLRGIKRSAATRKRMSEGMKGYKKTPEHLAKIGATLKGRIIDEEWRRKIGESSSKVVRTEIWRKRISDALKGRKLSSSAREKIKAAHQNRSKEWLENMRLNHASKTNKEGWVQALKAGWAARRERLKNTANDIAEVVLVAPGEEAEE